MFYFKNSRVVLLVLTFCVLCLLIMSCTENEPTVTSAENTTTTGVTTTATTTASTTTTTTKKGIAIVDIPITEIGGAYDIREIIEDNFDNFEADLDYIIYDNINDIYEEYDYETNGEKYFYYIYLRHGGCYFESAYKFTVVEGRVKEVLSCHEANTCSSLEEDYQEYFLKPYTQYIEEGFDEAFVKFQNYKNKKEIIAYVIDRFVELNLKQPWLTRTHIFWGTQEWSGNFFMVIDPDYHDGYDGISYNHLVIDDSDTESKNEQE